MIIEILSGAALTCHSVVHVCCDLVRTAGGPSGKIAVVEEPRFVPAEERQRVAGDGRSLRQGQSRAVHGFGQTSLPGR